MGFHVDHLPKSVGRRLKQYHRRKRLFSFARVVMGTLLVLGLLALVTMHIDRFAFLSWNTRMALVIGTFCASGTYGTVSLIRFFIRKPSPRQIAYELESKLPPEVEERFVSLEDILRHTDESVQDEVGEKLLDDLKNSAIAQSGGLAPASLVTDRKARNLFRGCLFLGIVYAVFFLPQSYEFGLMGKRFLMPWRRDLPKPSFVKISVSPGSAIFFVEQPQEFHEPRAGEIKAKLQETLGREIQATFEDTSLKKVTGWFSQQMGGKVQVKLLNGKSIEDRKVTLNAQGTVRELLSRLCRDMDLAWTGIGEKKVVVGVPARVWFSGKTNSRTSEKFRRELMERLSTNVALNLQDAPAPKAADLLAEQVDIDISFPSEGFETRTVNLQGRMRVQGALFRVAENTGTFWHVEQNVVRGKGSELVLQAESRGRIPAAVKWLVEKLGGSTTKCFIAPRNL
ncbi:MAG: hypothetical protein KGZ25_07440, partial [Planctomycetes bacterium]|nr:hypothetical protein [Planctomycetota bacterium]